MKPHVLGLFFCHVGSDTISGRVEELMKDLLYGWLHRLNIIATSGLDWDYKVFHSGEGMF